MQYKETVNFCVTRLRCNIRNCKLQCHKVKMQYKEIVNLYHMVKMQYKETVNFCVTWLRCNIKVLLACQ